MKRSVTNALAMFLSNELNKNCLKKIMIFVWKDTSSKIESQILSNVDIETLKCINIKSQKFGTA